MGSVWGGRGGGGGGEYVCVSSPVKDTTVGAFIFNFTEHPSAHYNNNLTLLLIFIYFFFSFFLRKLNYCISISCFLLNLIWMKNCFSMTASFLNKTTKKPVPTG